MKKPDISPGPWRVDWDAWEPHDDYPRSIDIVFTPLDERNDDPNYNPEYSVVYMLDEADAKAISAVPEMLDALIECYKLGDKVLHNEEINIEDWIEAMKPTEKALKKAGVETD